MYDINGFLVWQCALGKLLFTAGSVFKVMVNGYDINKGQFTTYYVTPHLFKLIVYLLVNYPFKAVRYATQSSLTFNYSRTPLIPTLHHTVSQVFQVTSTSMIHLKNNFSFKTWPDLTRPELHKLQMTQLLSFFNKIYDIVERNKGFLYQN